MKQKLVMNGVDVEVEINPPKLYGKIFTDWVEENYRGVLPKLTIEKPYEKILSGGYGEKPVRLEWVELCWRYENDICSGNTKTIRMKSTYNHDGSIKHISFSDGLIDRCNSKSHITTERGLKISMRNIKKKFLDNPRYRGKPSYYTEEEMWSSEYDD